MGNEIIVYTDGASKGNPGQGGYGWYMRIENSIVEEKSFGIGLSTNNQAELHAVIDALKTINKYVGSSTKKYTITVYSDSQYICKPFNLNWLSRWVNEDFSKIKNPDLWKKLYSQWLMIIEDGNDIKFEWVKGHSDDIGNIIADELAQLGCYKEGLIKHNKHSIKE